jgi:hypothetical protein
MKKLDKHDNKSSDSQAKFPDLFIRQTIVIQGELSAAITVG